MSARTTALAVVETLLRPEGFGQAVEIVVAGRGSRAFPPRHSSTFGVCLKLGPSHHVTADGRDMLYPADQICVRPVGCIWSSQDTGPTGFVSIDLPESMLPEQRKASRMAFVARTGELDVGRIARVLMSAATQLAKDEMISRMLTAISEHEITSWPELADTASVRALARARAFLHDYRHGNPSLDEVAAVAQLNKHVLVRRFRAHYGTTPYRYFMMVKIERARELLARGEPAGAVALSLGFADQAHLTRIFRRAVGIAPAGYQRSVRAAAG